MELLPIIYNTLLIAIALFVVTIAVSYIVFKLKKNKNGLEQDRQPDFGTIFKDKKRVEETLKPHYQTKSPKSAPPRKEDRKPERIEHRKAKPKQEHKPKSNPKKKIQENPEPKRKSDDRLERVTILLPNEKFPSESKRKTNEQRKIVSEESKKKKNLKSINDDPLKKYTDSAEDDLHPLKTDD